MDPLALVYSGYAGFFSGAVSHYEATTTKQKCAMIGARVLGGASVFIALTSMSQVSIFPFLGYNTAFAVGATMAHLMAIGGRYLNPYQTAG